MKEKRPCGVCKGRGYFLKELPPPPAWGLQEVPYPVFRGLRKSFREYCNKHLPHTEDVPWPHPLPWNFLRRLAGSRSTLLQHLPTTPRKPSVGKAMITLSSLLIAEENGWTPQVEFEFERTHSWMRKEFDRQ